MTIYLYVKTHNKTGLEYLGQTKSNDPHKYPGSGVYWKLHLDKHGYDYTTEIIKECQTKEEVKEFGIHYSNLWNVMESNEWANLKIEQGDGGRQSEEVRKKISEAGKGRTPWNKGKQVWSEEDRKRIGEINKSRGPQSPETIAKRVAKNTGKIRTPEQLINMSNGQKNRIPVSDDTKFKMKESRCKGIQEGRIVPYNKGKKTDKPSASAKNWKVVLPDGTMGEISSLRKWCDANLINYQVMHRYTKLGKPYKGFLVIENQ
jgi:hypothetical protein